MACLSLFCLCGVSIKAIQSNRHGVPGFTRTQSLVSPRNREALELRSKSPVPTDSRPGSPIPSTTSNVSNISDMGSSRLSPTFQEPENQLDGRISPQQQPVFNQVSSKKVMAREEMAAPQSPVRVINDVFGMNVISEGFKKLSPEVQKNILETNLKEANGRLEKEEYTKLQNAITAYNKNLEEEKSEKPLFTRVVSEPIRRRFIPTLEQQNEEINKLGTMVRSAEKELNIARKKEEAAHENYSQLMNVEQPLNYADNETKLKWISEITLDEYYKKISEAYNKANEPARSRELANAVQQLQEALKKQQKEALSNWTLAESDRKNAETKAASANQAYDEYTAQIEAWKKLEQPSDYQQ